MEICWLWLVFSLFSDLKNFRLASKRSQKSVRTKARANILKSVLKIGFGGAVVYYVLHSKMIDFPALKEILLRPSNVALGLFCSVASVVLCSFRWFLLARTQGLSRPFRNIFELTMIGNFSNLFMPGAVGGDVVKAWYIAGEEPQRKTRAIFTVLLDRLVGLCVFFFFSSLALFFFSGPIQSPQLQLTAYAVWGISLSTLIFASFFFFPPTWENSLFLALIERLRKWAPLAKVVDAAMLYRHHPGVIARAVTLSMFSIGISTFLYKWMGDALGIPLSLSQYYFIVPVALTASAVPLLPGGIGVGQVAFFTLFSWAGVAEPDRGGSLCTAVQIYTILFNLLGVIFYTKYRRPPVTQTASHAFLQSHRPVSRSVR